MKRLRLSALNWKFINFLNEFLRFWFRRDELPELVIDKASGNVKKIDTTRLPAVVGASSVIFCAMIVYVFLRLRDDEKIDI